MQIDRKDYDPNLHEMHKALSVKQPYADRLTKPIHKDAEGNWVAQKTIEVRGRNTTYRGDLLICSSVKPVLPTMESGVTCGFVELYDTKPVEDFTEADWLATCIPADQRPKKGYGWLMRNPRRVVEMPVKGQLGIYNLLVQKGDITEYPRELKLDNDGWEAIQRKIQRK